MAGTEPHGRIATFDELYERMWWPMLRVAFALVDDVSAAEDVVQDAFAGLHRRWDGLTSPAAAAGYLRVSVVNRARSVLRRRMVARRGVHLFDDGPAEAADATTMLLADRQLVRAALAKLPDRQREVLTIDAIWTSDDAGSSWAEHVLRFTGSGTVVAATFGDAMHGWLLRSHPSTYDIYATADGGATWTLQATLGGHAAGIVSVDAKHAWAYG